MENYCNPSKPTPSELRLRNVLRSRKIPFKSDQVIWYTSCDCFTPDLIIGKSLIIEVDGKIHDKDHRKTLDRIRQRALENMGYTVQRVKNEAIRDRPNDIANEIYDIYTILSDTENKKETIITELKKPIEVEPIPKDIQFNLDFWATEFNKKLNDESWSVEFFRESLTQYHPELSKNQCAMEKLILVLHGLNLRKTSDGGNDNLDFEYSLKFFKKSLNLLKESAPGFFKNLIFKGGPNINTGLVSIKDKDSLNFHIDNFNKYLSQLGITVEPLDIIQECKATLHKFKEEKKTDYNWLIEWINTTN